MRSPGIYVSNGASDCVMEKSVFGDSCLHDQTFKSQSSGKRDAPLKKEKRNAFFVAFVALFFRKQIINNP